MEPAARVLGLVLADEALVRPTRERVGQLGLTGVDCRRLYREVDVDAAPSACLVDAPSGVVPATRAWRAPVLLVLGERDDAAAEAALAAGAHDCLLLCDPPWRWVAPLRQVLAPAGRPPALELAQLEGLLNRELCRLVGHELGNQANGLGTALEVLMRELPADSRARTLGQTALESVRATNDRLRTFLQALRGHPPRPGSASLRTLLGEAARLQGFAGQQHELRVGEWPERDEVRADADLIRVALYVLLADAGAEVHATAIAGPGFIALRLPWAPCQPGLEAGVSLRRALVRRIAADARGRLEEHPGEIELRLPRA